MKVSVIIPVYNASTYLEKAVLSALAQPETAEVLLIEDGSTDASLQVCEGLAYQHSRIRILHHENSENRGAGASRNVGILNAGYPYIAFLDADDYYLPDRFSQASMVFEQHPEADGVYDAVGIHIENESAKRSFEVSPIFEEDIQVITFNRRLPPNLVFDALISGGSGHFHCNGIVVKRSIFDKTGLFDECLRFHQDTAMWMKMAAVGCLLPGSIDKPVAVYRIYSNNRIFSIRSGHNPYQKKLVDLTCEWGYRNCLDPRKMRLLLYHRWICSLYNYDSDLRQKLIRIKTTGPKWKRIPCAVGFVGSRLIQRPSLLFSKQFLYLVYLQTKKVFRKLAKAGPLCRRISKVWT
jgi:glycosyltransferase involved in cell wall biosynthesis